MAKVCDARSAQRALVGCVIVIGGCGASAEPAPSTPPVEVVPVSYRPPPPCRRQEDCLEMGMAATDPAEADTLLALACEKESARGCLERAKLQISLGDAKTAHAGLRRLCRTPSKYKDGCDVDAPTHLYDDTCFVDACAWLAVEASSDEAWPTYATRACTLDGKPSEDDRVMRGRACAALAAHLSETGKTQQASSRQRDACSLGYDDACAEALAEPKPKPTAPVQPGGATVTMPEITTDGLVLRDVECQLRGDALIGLLGGITVGAGFSQRLAQLKQCSSQPYTARLSWEVEKQRVINVDVTDAPSAVASCVKQRLMGAIAIANGTCRATLDVSR